MIGVVTKLVRRAENGDLFSNLETYYNAHRVMPFNSNLSSRIIKSPKVYFIDSGFACRLKGWTSREGEEIDYLIQKSPNQYIFY